MALVLTREGLREAHRRRWGGNSGEVSVYGAPGRVVLLGGGPGESLAVAAAIDVGCYVTRSRNAAGELRVISENLGQERRWPVSALPVVQAMGEWSDLVVGVAKELFRAGYAVEPANLRVHSDVPLGAGLGAGAALTVAVARALLGGREVAEAEVTRVCRRAGTRFAGRAWGAMDPAAAAAGGVGMPEQWPEELAIVVVDGLVRPAERWSGREEDERVRAFSRAGSAAEWGAMLGASEAELPAAGWVAELVAMAGGVDGVYGARGAGGGCAVLLVDAARAGEIGERYRLASGEEPPVYRGTGRIVETFHRCAGSKEAGE